jgi:hypothetical protein
LSRRRRRDDWDRHCTYLPGNPDHQDTYPTRPQPNVTCTGRTAPYAVAVSAAYEYAGEWRATPTRDSPDGRLVVSIAPYRRRPPMFLIDIGDSSDEQPAAASFA